MTKGINKQRKNTLTRTSLGIPKDLFNEMKAFARNTRRTQTAIIVDAVRLYIAGANEGPETAHDTPPTVKRKLFSHEAREYWCPVCKHSMEETDRQDVVDRFGNTKYHNCELSFECTHCSKGALVTLAFPYID